MNQGFEYREQLGADSAGQTALDYLVRRYAHSTEAVWRERLDAGEVRLDGVRAEAGTRVRPGQSLIWHRPPWEEAPVPLAFAILYRDDHLLAVAKPRGLPSVPNGGFLTHTLLHLVRRIHPDATPLHRLGRGTSGLVLFACTPHARRTIAKAWREGGVEKDYRALVAGVPATRELTIETPIGPVPHPRLGTVHAASPNGRAAVSHVRVLAAGADRAIVSVRIPTGRPHQIRIHLAAAGHPLVGDPLYATGGILRTDAGLPGDPGYRLHATRLALRHPDGHRLEIECAPPPELRCVLTNAKDDARAQA